MRAELKAIMNAHRESFRTFPEFDRVQAMRKSVYKFVYKADKHIDRNFQFLRALRIRPWHRVFEIGPGPCYFMWMCRRLGCKVRGIDRDEEGQQTGTPHVGELVFYQHCRNLLGVSDLVKQTAVAPFVPTPFDGKYDRIVWIRSGIKPLAGWDRRSCGCFVRDALRHLTPRGILCMSVQKRPSQQRLFARTNPRPFRFFRGTFIWPRRRWLRPPHNIDVYKLRD